jgi:DNA mismatch repair protein MSH5
VHSDAMAQACDVCAELDCLLSFSEASRAYEYRRPQMVGHNIVDIQQGRYAKSLPLNDST